MPARLRVQLENDNTTRRNEAASIIEVLGRLCDQDKSVEAAYLCHPAVQRISKARKEGNLCGYRNIQMMISYINGAEAQGSKHFSDGLPSVHDLQDLIEEAWDKGINSEGRVETGGIRGTRKYIGTPEVCRKSVGAIYNLYDRCNVRTNVEALHLFQSFPSSTLPFIGTKQPLMSRHKHSFAVSESAAGQALTLAKSPIIQLGRNCSTTSSITFSPHHQTPSRQARSTRPTFRPSTCSDHATLSPSSAMSL
jgi:hypothetical protein